MEPYYHIKGIKILGLFCKLLYHALHNACIWSIWDYWAEICTYCSATTSCNFLYFSLIWVCQILELFYHVFEYKEVLDLNRIFGFTLRLKPYNFPFLGFPTALIHKSLSNLTWDTPSWPYFPQICIIVLLKIEKYSLHIWTLY